MPFEWYEFLELMIEVPFSNTEKTHGGDTEKGK